MVKEVKTNDNVSSNLPTIYYRNHDSKGKTKRVWRSDWAGDQFNVVEEETFKFIEKTFQTFGFLVREYADDDE